MKAPLLVFSVIVYVLMAILQFFWFQKMFKGCMKAVRKAMNGGADKAKTDKPKAE